MRVGAQWPDLGQSLAANWTPNTSTRLMLQIAVIRGRVMTSARSHTGQKLASLHGHLVPNTIPSYGLGALHSFAPRELGQSNAAPQVRRGSSQDGSATK